MAEDTTLIGKQIDKYRVIEEIGSGSFGTVYRAHQVLTDDVVALKVLYRHLSAPERERFMEEVHVFETLRHRSVLTLVDVGFYDEGRPYFVSEYTSGGSLRQRLNETPVLPLDQVLTILTQVIEALRYASRQGVIHGDLKPENILFNAQGEACLTDFGAATVLAPMSIKQLAEQESNSSYLAPEHLRGQISRKTDQYVLGCIVYEMLTGQRAFAAPGIVAVGSKRKRWEPIPPRQINAQIPVHVEQAVLQALAKQRTQRHEWLTAFLDALRTPTPRKAPGQSYRENCEKKLAAYEQMLLVDPNNVKVYIYKGIELRSLMRYEEALEAFEQALSLDPNDATVFAHKANALDMLRRYEEAVEAYGQVSRLDPTNLYAYNSKGNILYQLRRYEEAVEAFEQAVRLKPDFGEAHNSKGNALYNLKRYEEAVEAYEEAVRVDPNGVYYYNNKGTALCNLKRYEEAVEAFEEAVRLRPDFGEAHNNKGNALYNLKRYEEAVEAFAQVLRIDPKDTNAYGVQGISLYHLQRYDEAFEAIEQALRIHPDDINLFASKGNMLFYLNRYEEALEVLSKYYVLVPTMDTPMLVG